MSPVKFLIIVLVVTLLALPYVYQQNKIIQMAYQEQEKLVLLESLVEKNNNFKYNINHRTSLVSIGGFWQDKDFEFPHRRQLVSMSTMRQTQKDNKQTKELENIFTRLFLLRSQAEATPVKSR